MYNIIGTDTVAASDPASAFGAEVGAEQSIYVIVANSAAGVCSIARSGAEEGSTFEIPADETWIFGPLLGRDLGKHGLFSAEAEHDAEVTYVAAAGRMKVDRRRGGYFSEPNALVPLTFRPLVPAVEEAG